MTEFSQKTEWVEIVSGPGTSTSNGQKIEHGVLGEHGGPETRREKQGRYTEEVSLGVLNSGPRGRDVQGAQATACIQPQPRLGLIRPSELTQACLSQHILGLVFLQSQTHHAPYCAGPWQEHKPPPHSLHEPHSSCQVIPLDHASHLGALGTSSEKSSSRPTKHESLPQCLSPWESTWGLILH